MEKYTPNLRKITRKALEESYARYYGLLMNLDVGIIIHAPDTSIIMNNPRASELFCLNEDQLQGQMIFDPQMEFIGENNMPLAEAEYLVNRIITSCQPINNQIFGIRRPSTDDVTWLLANGFPLLDNNGNLFEVVISFIDITDHKLADESLRESEEKYRKLSIIDDLTGLYNSRHFCEQLKMETNRVNRHGQSLTLLMLDIDNFKAFNDTYGHVEGNNLLSRFGKIIKRCLRQIDSAYRYGGEEFMIILPITTMKQGVATAEKIRKEFKNEIFCTVSGKDIHATVSIGVAQYRPHKDVTSFIRRADQLMYEAKKKGKDRVFHENLILPE